MQSLEELQDWSSNEALPIGLWVELNEAGFQIFGSYDDGTPGVLVVDDRTRSKKGLGLPISKNAWKRLRRTIEVAELIHVDVFDGRQGKCVERRLGDRTDEEMGEVWKAAGRAGVSKILHVGCVSQRLSHWTSLVNKYRAPDCEVIVLNGPISYRVVPLGEAAA